MPGPHHNIWQLSALVKESPSTTQHLVPRPRERGYTLVALLAFMTVLAIFALAAAPSLRQQALREREREAIFRGEQVADAIRIYYSYQQSRLRRSGIAGLPTSMDQLLEGVPSGTKKRQVLRPSAARDPLSDSGEWKLIRPASTEMSEFTSSIMLYAENVRPTTRDPQLQSQEQLMAPIVINTGASGLSGPALGGDDDYSGPFIGTSSRSKSNSVIYYYGISRHDGWIFTPLFR